jgi:sugar phosphate isomerase/epimerase
MMTYTMARQGYEVEDFIKTAIDCKLDGIDWVSTYGRDPVDLKNMCHDVGLKIVAHTFSARKFVNGEKDWLDDIKRSIENAILMEAPIIMIPTSSRSDIARDIFRANWISALKLIAPLAQAAGLTLTVENFPGKTSAFVIADDFLQAKAEVNSLKLTYDNGNAASGEDPVETFRKCAMDIVHAHYKDWYISEDYRDGYLQFLDGRYYCPALIGQGDVDTAGVWQAMKDYGYNGYINIEYESNTVKAPEGIKMAADFLRGL